MKKFDKVNIPKEQRLPKEQRIREDKSRGGRGPATEIQTGGPEQEKTRGNEKKIERGRVIAPETAPETRNGTGSVDKREQGTTEDLRRGLPRDRNIQKDTGREVVPPSRTTMPPNKRVEGVQTEKRFDRGGSEQTREPGFRRDKPRTTDQDKEGKQKPKKEKDQKEQKNQREKKGDKDKEEAPR